MSIVSILIGLAIIGFICYLIMQIPMLPVFKNVIVGIVIFVLILWLLQQFGFVGSIPNLKFK